MNDDGVIEQGRRLSEELAGERRQAGPHRWRCSLALRGRTVAYAMACAADGESHRCCADRLGLVQPTLSRWIRTSRQPAGGLRQVAIVPSPRGRTAAPGAAAPLRLVSPHGYVVEGLGPELLASLLRVIG